MPINRFEVYGRDERSYLYISKNMTVGNMTVVNMTVVTMTVANINVEKFKI